jgi:hypothetical protein
MSSFAEFGTLIHSLHCAAMSGQIGSYPIIPLQLPALHRAKLHCHHIAYAAAFPGKLAPDREIDILVHCPVAARAVLL